MCGEGYATKIKYGGRERVLQQIKLVGKAVKKISAGVQNEYAGLRKNIRGGSGRGKSEEDSSGKT